MYVDMELTYTVTDDLSLHFGAANIFDQYVDKVDAPYANRNSVGLPYPRRSAANYEGGSWYLKTQFTF
jgi:iron complex outermembrane receptor protein